MSDLRRRAVIGVLGCGYWGPNHIRNFSRLDVSRVKYACDLDQARLDHIGRIYPQVLTTSELDLVLGDPEVDGVVVATPVSTHHEFGRRVLEAGKHLLVEKPFTRSLAEGSDLVTLAASRRRTIMPGFTFLFSKVVWKIKDLVQSGELGRIYYINMQRLNLGLFQKDINVIWDLAPHDISILRFLLDEEPVEVSATGRANVFPGIEDVAAMAVRFASGIIAYVQCSWLDPNKIRRTTIVGDRKMLVYDDVKATDKIEIYDKGVEAPRHYDTFGEFRFSYFYGDKVTPYIQEPEPLEVECRSFASAILDGTKPAASGADAVAVLRVLEAAQRSLAVGGRFETV